MNEIVSFKKNYERKNQDISQLNQKKKKKLTACESNLKGGNLSDFFDHEHISNISFVYVCKNNCIIFIYVYVLY